MKKYKCYQLYGIMLIIGSFGLAFGVYFLFGFTEALAGRIFIFCDSLVFFIWTFEMWSRRVEIYKDRIVYKSALSIKKIEIEYEKCNLGFDYSVANGSKVWWIYFCYGLPPKYTYKKGKTINRINAEKYRPGFIKIMYDPKLYELLLQELPKKQCKELRSSFYCNEVDAE